jgi:hypothetical protein
MVKLDIPIIISKISKFTTYKNRLKRMKALLNLESDRDAAQLVVKRWFWFDLDFVRYCEKFR